MSAEEGGRSEALVSLGLGPGANDEEMQQFFAMGMLMNVIASMDATSHSSAWIKACLPPAWLAPEWAEQLS